MGLDITIENESGESLCNLRKNYGVRNMLEDKYGIFSLEDRKIITDEMASDILKATYAFNRENMKAENFNTHTFVHSDVARLVSNLIEYENLYISTCT